MSSHGRNNSTTQIEEELAQIKRYEDFTTTDWVKDAILERYRQSAVYNSHANDKSWRGWWQLTFENFESWLVVLLIGSGIGLLSALIAIVTDWLSDIKKGYCSTAWWLNEKFCCWEMEDNSGSCADWTSWSEFVHLGPEVYVVKWFFYILWATLFATTCAYLVKKFAPYAAGSGISEIKCIIGGFVMKGFLGVETLIMKSIGLTMSVASNLSIGKEGPSVHMACCVGNVIARCFKKFKTSRAEMREILTASSAAGVAVAFGSPIGGVIFALEEMSNHFPNRTMWKSFFCAMIATIVLQAMNPFRTGKLVMFQVSYDREWHFFEYLFVVFIGLFGGLYGAFVIKYNLLVVQFRKKYLKNYPVVEAAVLAFITAILAYPNVFLRTDMTEIMGILFRECEGVGTDNYYGLCETGETKRMVVLLLIATILRCFGTIVSYGARVPCGIFVPSMAIGATFGRMVGLLVKSWHQADPEFFLFASCRPDMPCITPGTYAFLGAAAALCGVMRITVSVVVIMFELTGQITYILPTMIALMVTRAVGDWFGTGGIADRAIQLNGYPILGDEEKVYNVPVSHVMQDDMTVMTAAGMTFGDIENILENTNFQGFPVVDDSKNMVLIGYIGRSELSYLIGKEVIGYKALTEDNIELTDDEDNSKPNNENNDESTTGEHILKGSSEVIDFGAYMDQTPITVHPKLYLETVIDMFKQLGPRVVLLVERGKLKGLVTVKDVLKYTAKMERIESPNSIPNLRECGLLLDKVSSCLRRRRRSTTDGAYTQLHNRSSYDLEDDVEAEIHELDGRI
ncbi:chloride channel [Mycotypha africana]|uniref:chloride channel n=1 Tax=Mycotypha africana TaxID=64632 RepID=UPI0023014933|nr:chloride channel [Mycotypha africana]KAI8979489.1 chloride channel [Mycotypha africana]